MGKPKLKIQESDSQLAKLRKAQKTLKFEKRVIALQQLKAEEKSRKKIVDYLGIGKRTLESWITIYLNEGIEELLTMKARRKESKFITKEIHEGLERRANDPENAFLGYWDAQRWVFEEYGVEINYHTLRYYMVSKFGTKVKSPRKSHVKKDKEAQASFLKTAPEAQTY